MAHGSNYFSHDYNARSDSKIKALIRKHGLLGYGVFWSIVEDLYNNANALRVHCEGIAFDLRVKEDVVKSVLNDFDLFTIKDGIISSSSVQRRLDERNAKTLKARESATVRWSKNANAMRTHSERNANKGKERKVKENNIEERKQKFASTLEPFVKVYGRDMLNAFFKYWIEPNKSLTKLRFELEKTWDTGGRLSTWAKNDKTFNPQPIEVKKPTGLM